MTASSTATELEKKDWYSYGEIIFKEEEIIFIFENYEILKKGQYPPDPKQANSGYIDFKGITKSRKKRGRKRRWANFEKPIDLVAEIDERMKLIGPDSSILRDIYIIGMKDYEAAQVRGIDEATLARRKRRAMNKMCGWRRQDHDRQPAT